MGSRFKGELKALVERIHSTEVRVVLYLVVGGSTTVVFSSTIISLSISPKKGRRVCILVQGEDQLQQSLQGRISRVHQLTTTSSLFFRSGAIHPLYSSQHGEQSSAFRGRVRDAAAAVGEHC